MSLAMKEMPNERDQRVRVSQEMSTGTERLEIELNIASYL